MPNKAKGGGLHLLEEDHGGGRQMTLPGDGGPKLWHHN